MACTCLQAPPCAPSLRLACPLDKSASGPAAAAALLWRQKEFADFLGTPEVSQAWADFYAVGSGDNTPPSDPTGAGAQQALAQALVDGFASDAAAAKLRGMATGSAMADLQAKLVKAAG